MSDNVIWLDWSVTYLQSRENLLRNFMGYSTVPPSFTPQLAGEVLYFDDATHYKWIERKEGKRTGGFYAAS